MHHQTPTRSALAATCFLTLILLCSFGVACSEQTTDTKPAAKPSAAPSKAPPAEAEPEAAKAVPEPVDLAKRGRSIYMANCIACHSQDPAQDGALGPAVTGSSRELIEARVIRAEYPEGYTPKRSSRVMIALPHLGNELDALTAFLASGS